jgi:hypothetical protein
MKRASVEGASSPLRRHLAIATVLCALALPGVRSADPAPTIASLAWLSGCWEGGAGERKVEEQWLAPRGGMMLGMSRTVVGDKTREFEQMFIREDGGKLVFTAKPSGQPEASFSSIEVTPTRVVFENPEHDFPQRVIYESAADGTMKGRIEGKQGDRVQGIDFPMRRATCPAGR